MNTSSDQPNVLLVCTDHWPGSLLGAAGHPSVITPTLDMLAGNGVRFSNAYSECPVCVPARRTLMTGLHPKDHGLWANGSLPMPEVPTVAQTFRDAGYQAYAVGKLHVNPQRQRLGFDDVILDEEGRGHEGCRADDYEMFLADHGYAGQRFTSGMNNNEYVYRPWHLPEPMHVTNWATQQMCRQIVRRDPTKPAFWYLSYSHPHPPLQPLQAYLDMYRDVDVPDEWVGDWAAGALDQLAPAVQHEIQNQLNHGRTHTGEKRKAILRAFYALCTHIDHQLRLVIGTLRQENLMDNTIIMFTADHGDMLGHHRMWSKHWGYEDSACVPMLLVGTKQQSDDGTVGHHRVDDRLVSLGDVMPTLLGLAGIDVPGHCGGRSMVCEAKKDYHYGGWGEQPFAESVPANRMVRDERYKLIYYPAGNAIQLFDMIDDPGERKNLAGQAEHAETIARLSGYMIDEFVGRELDWATDGKLTGAGELDYAEPRPLRTFAGQRGPQFPTPRVGNLSW